MQSCKDLEHILKLQDKRRSIEIIKDSSNLKLITPHEKASKAIKVVQSPDQNRIHKQSQIKLSIQKEENLSERLIPARLNYSNQSPQVDARHEINSDQTLEALETSHCQ